MTVDNIDIEATLSDLARLLKEDKNISPALKSTITVLMLVVKLLANKLGLNSHNSSKSPSSDQNRKKKKQAIALEKRVVGKSVTMEQRLSKPKNLMMLKS